jgi:membrane protein implicated in regulation of membrane protease activity
MSTLLLIFLITGGIGFLFLMISLIIGDIFDALDLDFGADVDFDADVDADVDGGGAGFGVLDSRVISMFLTAFGFVGAIALQLGVGGVLGALIGIGSGLILGGLIFAFGYYLVSQEASSPVTNRELVGHAAKVIVDIKPNSIGQISFNVREQRIDKLARTRNGKEIKAGETVFIEEIAGNEFIVSSMDIKDYELLSEKN